MKKLRVDVTAEDIATGNHCYETCPIALAATRAISEDGTWPGQDRMRVGRRYMRDTAKSIGKIALPDEARRFVLLFDNHDPVGPFSFEVDIPETAGL